MTLIRESEPSSPGREIGGVEPSSTMMSSSSPLKFWSRIDLTARTSFSCRLKVGIMRESCGISWEPCVAPSGIWSRAGPDGSAAWADPSFDDPSPYRSTNPHALLLFAYAVCQTVIYRSGAPGTRGCRDESPVETPELATLPVAPGHCR